ncbi:MAG: hypothetical protein N3E51_05335 [Candidatus Micrarchaeota archaeon]|nr:hypothetical protein [Candidatus Micrarchaeota archaeon]MCX8175597.1 hypothetical protein [Candidatus Micrarchaeota archaeon]
MQLGEGLAGLILNKVATLAYLLAFFAAGLLFYLVLLNLMRLFEHEDAAVLRRMLRGRVPDWAEKTLIRSLFWNQKEIH